MGVLSNSPPPPPKKRFFDSLKAGGGILFSPLSPTFRSFKNPFYVRETERHKNRTCFKNNFPPLRNGRVEKSCTPPPPTTRFLDSSKTRRNQYAPFSSQRAQEELPQDSKRFFTRFFRLRTFLPASAAPAAFRLFCQSAVSWKRQREPSDSAASGVLRLLRYRAA